MSADADDPSLPDELFAPFVATPGRGGLFADFDGTLSALVQDPDEASLVDGATSILDGLASVLGRVGVLSGRPVEFLEPLLPASVMISGLYGLQKLDHGVRDDHPLGGAWREVTDDIAALALERGPEGMRVEDKGLSITLHYRGRPELADDVRRWADAQAARSGLVVRPAKMSYELHPPIEADKGTALLEVVDDLDAVCFIGDDVGDHAAFDALDRLAESGIRTARVAVSGPETPQELVVRADLVVEGPDGVVALLERLLAALATHRKAS